MDLSTRMSEIVVSGKDSRSLVRALDSIHPFPKSARYNTRTTSDMTEHGHDREAFCVGILHSFRQGPRVGVKTKWPHLQDAQSACISMVRCRVVRIGRRVRFGMTGSTFGLVIWRFAI